MISFLLIVLWIVGTLVTMWIAAHLTKRLGYGILVGVYSGLVVTSSLAASKLISVFGLVVPAGVIVYAMSFLATDLLSECYGKREARVAVWAGLFSMALFFAYSKITVYWPAASFYQNTEAYNVIAGQSARIALAGLIAFVISQLWDIFVFHLLKERHGRAHLWARNIGSTVGSQLIDTAVFISIAFYGVAPILPLIGAQYLIKVMVAGLDTPFAYWGRRIITGKGQE